MTTDLPKPGQRIRVHQTIVRREQNWFTAVEGVLEAVEEQPTGSWYAHAKDDRLWLRRLRLRMDDGEVTVLSCDQHTRIEVVA